MLEKYKNKIFDIVVLVLLLALLIIGTKLDYKFSDNIYNGDSIINYLMASIAKLPAFFIALYGCVCLFILSRFKENKDQKYILMAIYLLGGIVCGTLMLEDVVETFVEGIWKYLIAASLGAGIFCALYFTMISKDYESMNNSKKDYIAIVLTVAIITVVVFLLKEIIDRTRFEDLLERKGVFTNWYEKGTGGDSFPSGHVAIAAALFAVIPMMRKIQIFKGKDWLSYLVITIYVLCVAISRVSFGKHFLSDVAVGALVGFIISKGICWVLYGFNEDKLEIKTGTILDKI